MKFSNEVFELAENFMVRSYHVRMRGDMIEALAYQMKQEGNQNLTYSQGPDPNTLKAILVELVASSINYCYWYGKANIRPNESSSTTMYKIVENRFKTFSSTSYFKDCLTLIQRELSLARFPLLEERVKHIEELKGYGTQYAEFIQKNTDDLETCFTHLIAYFPGFASDIFLKRASLFFIQLYRRYKWFANDLHNLHVPADYQIPKMLSHFGCIEYSNTLYDLIYSNSLIPKHSLMECEIRSATILTMRELCKITGWNIADVDGWLFSKRHEPKGSFHLTITTDY